MSSPTDDQISFLDDPRPSPRVAEIGPCVVCGLKTMRTSPSWGWIHALCEPAHTDSTGHETSYEAGRRAPRGPRSLLAQEIRRLFSVHGAMTDDELCRLLPEAHPGTLAKRRHSLMKAGLVVDSGDRRPTRRGVMAIVWRLADS